MSPEKRAKCNKNEKDENLPFDIYRSESNSTKISEKCNTSGLPSKSTEHVMSNPNFTGVIPTECDEDDEENFISKYKNIN